MSKVKCTINNVPVEVDAGSTILEAARQLDVFIPAFCHLDELKPESYCYVCVVEVDGCDDLVPSCSTEVRDGMVIKTETDRVKQSRKTCVELLLSDHLGDCLGPCMTTCPAGIDIPGFIDLMAQGENRKALELIKATMPLPGVLGRICKRPCEEQCRRQLVEDPISICFLHRFVADEEADSSGMYVPGKARETGKNVAIVGAGPAGLTAAYYLQVLGHQCTLYDKNSAPGGMLRYGVPNFRLPLSVIDNEVSVLEKLGVKFQYNTALGPDVTLDELRLQNDAVFVGTGTGRALSLGIDGCDSDGIISGLDFLQEQAVSPDADKLKGKKVAVIGGGDVAVDAARVAVRSGAGSVTMYSLEKSKEMPASDHELKEAKAEGVKISNEVGVKAIDIKNGRLCGLEFMKCVSVFDEDGCFCPDYDDSDTSNIDCETVIVAIGQAPESLKLQGINKKDNDLIMIHPDTLQTSLKDVFAGGDCVTGPGSAVDAVGAGRRAAIAIDQFVMGQDVTGEPYQYNSSLGGIDSVPEGIAKGIAAMFSKESRANMPVIDAAKRTGSFDEVETGLTKELALSEAQRCMKCGCRDAHECKLRAYATCFHADEGAYSGETREFNLDDSHPDIIFESHKCISCRKCVRITAEILGTNAMKVVGRGFAVSVKPDGEKMSMVNSEGLMKIVKNCPVGALTLKTDPVQVLDPVFKRPEVKC